MSQILISGRADLFPYYPALTSTGYNTVTLNATGETCHFVGQCILENPSGGSKTLSSAGGGSIVWKTASVTFADAGTTFDVGIQDVSTTSTPAQGDGTFDVKASFTGGGGGVTGSAVQTSAMTTGTKTIANGDLIAITLAMTARGGTDSVAVSTKSIPENNVNAPCVVTNTSGSYARSSSQIPNAYIIFDDSTIGWLYGSMFSSNGTTTETFASDTATADEYGNIITIPATYNAIGISAFFSGLNTSDLELILYSNPLGTPVAERTITVDADTLSTTAAGFCQFMFSSPFLMKANTPYAVTLRPTTTNAISTYYTETTSDGMHIGAPNATAYSCRRLDNSGAFSDYNGGTAKSRLMLVFLSGSYIEQGVNQCFNQLGI